jgi:hypothetical protein
VLGVILAVAAAGALRRLAAQAAERRARFA